jgi:LPS-assembly protein
LLNVQARFNETDFGIKRSDLTMAYNDRAFSLSTNYTYIDAQPSYGFNNERQQIGFASIVDINDNWKVFGGAQYNVEADIVVSDNFGLTYHDECFTLSLGFKESRSTSVAKTSRSLSFKIGLRTIGDYEHSFNDSQYEDFADQNNF